jgi:hypothetical protein
MTAMVTVSGSFRRALDHVAEAVLEFSDLGALVLSPADPRIVDQFGEFVFVASDRARMIRLVQQRHFVAISHSDLLWLVCPDGYVGISAALELGWAARSGVPIFSDCVPNDLTVRHMVTLVSSKRDALQQTIGRVADHDQHLLLDPAAGAAEAHRQLEVIERELLTPINPSDHRATVTAAATIRRLLTGIQ